MKPILSAIALSLATATAFAAPGDNAADLYFSTNNPTLTQQEKAAIAISQRWQRASATGIKPVDSGDGYVRFIFGAQGNPP